MLYNKNMELEQIGIKINNDNQLELTATKINVRSKKNKKVNILVQKYKQLYEIYYQLYDTLNIPMFDMREIIVFDNVIAYPEEHQAEVIGTQFLNIDERIKINGEWLNGKR